MNQGKIVVAIAVVLGICAGLAGYWWNYRIGHRALAFWGQETSRLVRLAPKVEYLSVTPADSPDAPNVRETKGMLKIGGVLSMLLRQVDLSQARGLIHLRNAILSDDQFDWNNSSVPEVEIRHALRFTDNNGVSATLYFDLENKVAFNDRDQENIHLGPLAKSLEQFLARELPRAEKEATASADYKQPEPAKLE
jgi:hypothetical protein